MTLRSIGGVGSTFAYYTVRTKRGEPKTPPIRVGRDGRLSRRLANGGMSQAPQRNFRGMRRLPVLR